MSNRIIKDFKGWNLLTEDNDIVKPIAQTSPLNSPTPNLNFSNPIPGVTPPTSEPTPATPAKPAAAKVKAAPPVPTADLKTANAAALTPSDWAAIQTKLNVANLDLPQILNKEVSTNPNPLGLDIPLINTKANESRPITKLYESLVPDGLFGPLTLAAVADFVTKYNATPAGAAAPLPTTPPTATTIDPLVLAAIAAPAAPATSTTDTKTVAPTGPAATAGSAFGPSANITEADFAVTVTKDTRGYDQSSYSEPTKLLLATAKQFKSATSGRLGTSADNLIASIKACKSASDFYKLNAVIKNIMSGDIAYIINDELGNDDLISVESIKKHLDELKIESSFDKARPSMNYENTPETDFKEGSFKITIPAGSDPATVFPQTVYAAAVEQSKKKTGSGDITIV